MRAKTLSEEFNVPQTQIILQHSIRLLMIHGIDPVPLQRVLGLVNDIARFMDEGVADFVQIDLLVGLLSITAFADPRYQNQIARQYLEGHRDAVRIYETHPPEEIQPTQLSWLPSWLKCFLNIFQQNEVHPGEMVDQYYIIPHGQHPEDASNQYYH